LIRIDDWQAHDLLWRIPADHHSSFQHLAVAAAARLSLRLAEER